MDNTVLVVIISSIAGIITTILTVRNSDAVQGEQIKQIKEEISTLSKKVEQHNNYGLEIVELKGRVDAIDGRVKVLERNG